MKHDLRHRVVKTGWNDFLISVVCSAGTVILAGLLLMLTISLLPMFSICAEASEETVSYSNIEEIKDADGNTLEKRYLDADGKPALCEEGYAAERRDYDEEGSNISISYYDEEDQPILNTEKGFASVEYEYDEDGNIAVERYFGTDGKRISLKGGYSGCAFEYYSPKKKTKETFLNDSDEPVVNTEKGYATIRREYDVTGYEVSTAYYDENDERMEKDGIAYILRTFDANGNVLREKKYNAKDQLVPDEKGFAWIERRYGRGRRAIWETFVDENGTPIMIGEYAQVRRKYDSSKRVTLEAYYDTEENPVTLKKGYQAVAKEYDLGKKPVLTTYLDAEGRPVMTAMGYAAVADEYDVLGNLLMEKWFDTVMDPVCPKEGYTYVAARREYSEDGDLARITYLDREDKPAKCADGYAILTKEYPEEENDGGAVDEEDTAYTVLIRYLDPDGNPASFKTKGYSIVEQSFNADDKLIGEAYYDAGMEPYAVEAKDYAYVRYELIYNEDGTKTKVFYGAEGQEVGRE